MLVGLEENLVFEISIEQVLVFLLIIISEILVVE